MNWIPKIYFLFSRCIIILFNFQLKCYLVALMHLVGLRDFKCNICIRLLTKDTSISFVIHKFNTVCRFIREFKKYWENMISF